MPVGVLKRALVLAVAVALFGACGSGGEGEGLAKPTAEETAFCEKILPEVWTGDQAAFNELAKNAPAGFNAKDDKFVVSWIEGHCYPNIGPEGSLRDQRVAVPRNKKLEPLQTCLAATSPPTVPDTSIVLYGKGDDPYAGEMLGILTGGSADGGDGPKAPVEVRGVIGVSAPLTVFKQNVFERLGTGVSWTENGVAHTLYGRLWENARVPGLVEVANKLVDVGENKLELPKAALPAGYREVYRGGAQNLALISPFTGIYEVELRDGSGLINISGREMSNEEFAATQFFTLDLRREKVGGRDAIVGHPWDSDTTSLVQFRDNKGIVVRLMAVGETLDRVLEVAKKTKSLSRSEWFKLSQIPAVCDSLG